MIHPTLDMRVQASSYQIGSALFVWERPLCEVTATCARRDRCDYLCHHNGNLIQNLLCARISKDHSPENAISQRPFPALGF
jgi:hypothetical protein